ncbi:MAG: carbohydrate ABC transporter permease [Clostridiales bacterium]|nr:carbohydrate ABC transporter permease [Clostridiales bacterium]
MKYKSRGEKCFDAFVIVLMALLAFLFLYPFIDQFWLSFYTYENSIYSGQRLIPRMPLVLDSYKEVFKNDVFLVALGNSVFRVILGTVYTVFFTFCGGYVLSKKSLPFRNGLLVYFMFTMFFSGGLVPSFILMRNLGLFNSRLAWILPGMTSAWNMILTRNFIRTVPEALEEAAVVDGAGIWRVMFGIMLPLSMPIISVLALWSAIGHWNSWFDVLLYTRKNEQLTLALMLRRIIMENSVDLLGESMTESIPTRTPDTVKAATMMTLVIPIACVYPFLQKYFVKGIHVGSVKG